MFVVFWAFDLNVCFFTGELYQSFTFLLCSGKLREKDHFYFEVSVGAFEFVLKLCIQGEILHGNLCHFGVIGFCCTFECRTNENYVVCLSTFPRNL